MLKTDHSMFTVKMEKTKNTERKSREKGRRTCVLQLFGCSCPTSFHCCPEALLCPSLGTLFPAPVPPPATFFCRYAWPCVTRKRQNEHEFDHCTAVKKSCSPLGSHLDALCLRPRVMMGSHSPMHSKGSPLFAWEVPHVLQNKGGPCSSEVTPHRTLLVVEGLQVSRGPPALQNTDQGACMILGLSQKLSLQD